MLAILPELNSPTGHVMLGAPPHSVEREVSATQTALSSFVGTYAHILGEERRSKILLVQYQSFQVPQLGSDKTTLSSQGQSRTGSQVSPQTFSASNSLKGHVLQGI